MLVVSVAFGFPVQFHLHVFVGRTFVQAAVVVVLVVVLVEVVVVVVDWAIFEK